MAVLVEKTSPYINCATVTETMLGQIQSLLQTMSPEFSVAATVLQIGPEPESFCRGLKKTATDSSIALEHYTIYCKNEGIQVIEKLGGRAEQTSIPHGLILALPSRPKAREDGKFYDDAQQLLELTNKLPKEILDPDGTRASSDVIPGVVEGALNIGHSEGLNSHSLVSVIGARGRFGSRLVARLLESGIPWGNIMRVDCNCPELNIDPIQALQSAEFNFLCTSARGFISTDDLPEDPNKRFIDIGWNIKQRPDRLLRFNGRITPIKNGTGPVANAAVMRTLTAMTFEQLTGMPSGVQYRFNKESLSYLS